MSSTYRCTDKVPERNAPKGFGYQRKWHHHNVLFPRSTAAILTLISSVIDPHLSTSSNRRIASIQMSGDSSIRSISLFQSDRTTSFKLQHLLLIGMNPSARHCYS
ncbi:hypothetical protein TNCV_2771691 [Trichonephila clavipes]|nr:hypothetical protein TNCV_2771691 [Trichonephila clavipes]